MKGRTRAKDRLAATCVLWRLLNCQICSVTNARRISMLRIITVKSVTSTSRESACWTITINRGTLAKGLSNARSALRILFIRNISRSICSITVTGRMLARYAKKNSTAKKTWKRTCLSTVIRSLSSALSVEKGSWGNLSFMPTWRNKDTRQPILS